MTNVEVIDQAYELCQQIMALKPDRMYSYQELLDDSAAFEGETDYFGAVNVLASAAATLLDTSEEG
ncbi:hypothetical protein [Secundilactobacillus odoratitofui]|uniref:hypothetical protein n=1 Tax=Secundilactobacillus odoratitofui TaxID=480930 RepID=UPI0006D215F7|nr:hypothetical protein [Secundilactobacillus odoratitofui]